MKKYEAERKPANIAMMAILDGFQKAYSVDFGPLNILRAAAFHGANYISPLKKSIISYASGDQRLPLFTWEKEEEKEWEWQFCRYEDLSFYGKMN